MILNRVTPMHHLMIMVSSARFRVAEVAAWQLSAR